MNALDENWLSADLARVDDDIQTWSPGIRESFDSLYGDSDQVKNLTADEQQVSRD